MDQCVVLQAQLQREVERCIAICAAYFEREFDDYALLINLRGRSAGQFRVNPRTRTNELRFNAELLMRYGQVFIDETAGHEVAHYVTYKLFGARVKPHGTQWQAIMREVLEQNPSVSHNYEVRAARKSKTYPYHCACPAKTHALGAVRHKRVKEGRARYLCRSCRTTLISSE